MKKFSTLTILLLTGLFGIQANAAMITNGSFEEGHNNPITWEFLPSITGWNEAPVTTNVEIHRGGFIAPTAQDGNYYVELNSHPSQSTPFELVQNIATDLGQQYKVTFWAQKREENDGSFSVSAGGSDSTVSSHVVGTWSMHHLLFTAASELTSLRFVSLDVPPGSDTIGHFLDNVEISAVPLPGALVLLGGGLLGLGAFRKRDTHSA